MTEYEEQKVGLCGKSRTGPDRRHLSVDADERQGGIWKGKMCTKNRKQLDDLYVVLQNDPMPAMMTTDMNIYMCNFKGTGDICVYFYKLELSHKFL